VVYWAILPESIYDKFQYANNRAEQSHETTRVRERGMRRIQIGWAGSTIFWERMLRQALINLGRHFVRAEHYRNLRIGAFAEWSRAVA